MSTIECKELSLEFDGVGQMSNFHFKQIKKTDFGYIYELTSENSKHFEVFERREQKEGDTVIGGQKVHFENKVMYPSNNAFGDWAFAPKSLEVAEKYLHEFYEKSIEKSLKTS